MGGKVSEDEIQKLMVNEWMKKSDLNENIKKLQRYKIQEEVIEKVAENARLFAQGNSGRKDWKALWDQFEIDYENYRSSDNIILKTAIGKKWAYKYNYDYDNSLTPSYIFCKTIFAKEKTELEYVEKNDYECVISCKDYSLRGDTMNSWSTTLNEFIRVYGESYIHSYQERYIPKGYDSWEDFLSERENYKKSFPSYIMEFMDVVYTIGNFVPVLRDPVNFNTKRFAATKDYWDLTLMGIYEYYTGRGSVSVLSNLLSEKAVRDWLDRFGDWNGFVEKNFMQPFVQKKGTEFGEPRELWDGHYAGNVLPKTEGQFEQFFVNAKVRILARGELIADAFCSQSLKFIALQ